MDLSNGTRIGPYELIGPLGAGGMGQVYRARDTRLGHEVAIKVAKEKFSERFEREARAIAALNHPNICHLYDVGPNYLVMELVEGPTLSERIKKGAIPLEEALGLARQIADALEAAHEKHIVHRDLKPGNIVLTPAGKVKVLDFGLAKVGGTPVAPTEDSPTVTLGHVDPAATEAGVVLGTASYMSPEQARGKIVDKRADVWAFGVVLFEMLTGKRLFKGEDNSEILAAVIKEEPDFTQIPARVRPVLRRCLEKDPKRRLRDIADAMAMLEETTDSGSMPVAESVHAALSGRGKWAAAAAVLVLAAAVGGAWLLKPAPEQRMFQMEITPPDGIKFDAGLTPFALSPDGRHIVFVGDAKNGKRMLWLRSIESTTAAALAGTEGAEIPFWSPDSRWVGFAANGKLQKMDITSSGQPQVICDVEGRTGGTWNSDGIILFDQGGKPLDAARWERAPRPRREFVREIPARRRGLDTGSRIRYDHGPWIAIF